MKVIGLDGKEHIWSLKSSELGDGNRSKLHLRARELVKEVFPFDKIYEDVTLPGSKTFRRKSLLYADIFIPARKIIIEVNGEQHTNHIPFFHKTKHEFLKAVFRDKDKVEWCDRNNIALVVFNYDEDNDTWRQILNDR